MVEGISGSELSPGKCMHFEYFWGDNYLRQISCSCHSLIVYVY